MPSSPPRAVLDWGLILAAAAIPLSLLWDYSWESTVGIDDVWAAPHLANYLVIAVAAALAGARVWRWKEWQTPWTVETTGAWLVLWGAVAFVTATLFDRWWFSAYGLAAGIWHPPQISKGMAFLVVIAGAWMASRQTASAAGGGVMLAMIATASLAVNFANRQHSAAFYLIACATYPLVLAAIAGERFAATRASLVHTALLAGAVWVLPLVPGEPLVAPIFHPRDHLLPPPFPVLLIAPAFLMDLLRRPVPKTGWADAVEAGGAFALGLLVVQWPFAAFLLSPSADHWFFAGGGRQWPFFLQIAPAAERAFWHTPEEALSPARALLAAGLAMVSAYFGLRLGAWMKGARR